MKKNKVGRPSDGIPRHPFHIYPKADEYWAIFDAAHRAGMTLTHYVLSCCLPSWAERGKFSRFTSAHGQHTTAPTDLERALFTNNIGALKEALQELPDDGNIFTSGKVALKEIYTRAGK